MSTSEEIKGAHTHEHTDHGLFTVTLYQDTSVPPLRVPLVTPDYIP